MPRASLKKIKSALSSLSPQFIIYGSVVLLVASGFLFLQSIPGNETPVQETRTLRTKTGSYALEVVRTAKEQMTGLSGRQSLAEGKGMLFAFDSVSEQCFWMKDMQFPIDIIWVDGWEVVTRVESNVSPDTFPNTYCADAKYVIELNAGVAAKNDIEAGKPLDF